MKERAEEDGEGVLNATDLKERRAVILIPPTTKQKQ